MESSSEATAIDYKKKTNGFLGFMKNRKKKTKQSKVVVEPIQQRRIVKAIIPPAPVTVALEKHEYLDKDVQDERDDSSEIHLPVNKLPLVQHQVDLDHAEKWRQQRLEVSAALRKEVKEREIKDHRFKSSEAGFNKSPKQSDSNGNTTVAVPNLDVVHSTILSVESQFPEHKRTVLERGAEEETSVKRSKYRDESRVLLVKAETKDHWTLKDKIRSLGVKFAVPAAATAVAIVAIGFMKFFRR